ncbi:hypothetical protein [Sphingomonas hankookensis]|uniref:hypothetical protein n=1 Tax=Sphingomonas hankookensis TaxID=563996 RepID=UPI003D301A11
MTNDTNGIDDKALSSLSVAPDGDESEAATPARGDAGRGGDQAEETDSDARLDRGLDESMDASDPPRRSSRAATVPPRRRAMTPMKRGSGPGSDDCGCAGSTVRFGRRVG